MALVTRCPNCGEMFRVGPEQLASRAGTVRCGSCRHVFNAIGCLDYVDAGLPTGQPGPVVPTALPAASAVPTASQEMV